MLNQKLLLKVTLNMLRTLRGEDYPIFPPPSQELLQQQPPYIPDEAMESEPYAEARNEHISPKSPPKHQDKDLEEDTEDGDEICDKVIESIEEEDQSKGNSWFNANGQMVMTKVPWSIMMQFIKNYVKSVASSQGPIWPVLNMNRSKKNEFHQKVSNYFMESGALFKYKCTDRLNKGKTCKYIPSFLYIVGMNNLI